MLAGAVASGQQAPVPAQTETGAPPPCPPGPPPKEILQKYDANQDGKLDETERAVLHQDVQAGKVTPPPRRPHGPPPGRSGPPPELLEQYDTNKDGQLDETEHLVVQQDIASGKLQPPGGARPPLTADKVLEKHDQDKDGKLDANELAGFLSLHRPPRPGPGHGFRGPRPEVNSPSSGEQL